HRTPPRTVDRQGAVGLLVPVRTLPPAMTLVLGVMAAVFVAFGVTRLVGGALAGDGWGAMTSLASIGIGVLLATVPVTALRAREPHPGLLLTPDALHLPGPGLPVVGWDQVEGTAASWVRRPVPGRTRPTVHNLL